MNLVSSEARNSMEFAMSYKL